MNDEIKEIIEELKETEIVCLRLFPNSYPFEMIEESRILKDAINNHGEPEDIYQDKGVWIGVWA